MWLDPAPLRCWLTNLSKYVTPLTTAPRRLCLTECPFLEGMSYGDPRHYLYSNKLTKEPSCIVFQGRILAQPCIAMLYFPLKSSIWLRNTLARVTNFYHLHLPWLHHFRQLQPTCKESRLPTITRVPRLTAAIGYPGSPMVTLHFASALAKTHVSAYSCALSFKNEYIALCVVNVCPVHAVDLN